MQTLQQSQPNHNLPEAEQDAPPKQVAQAMERLNQAARVIADIRLGADRILEAMFVASQPRHTDMPLQLFLREDASMRQHLQDLRLIGKKLEESGVLTESLRSRSNSWGLHMPLVCPDGAVVAYAWKRQLAGQAGASAVDRTRLALRAFTDQKRRYFPHIDDGLKMEPRSKKHRASQSSLEHGREEPVDYNTLPDIESHLVKMVPNVKVSTYGRLNWMNRANSLPGSGGDDPTEASKPIFQSSSKLRSGLENEFVDKVAVIELSFPSVFRAIVSLNPAGSLAPDAVAFFSPDEGGSYMHGRGLSVHHVYKHITEHAATALQYFLGFGTGTTLYSLLLWICSFESLFSKPCRQIHCSMIKMGLERDAYCGGALVDMYAKCNLIRDARRVFDGILDPNTVCWTCLFSGYVKAGLPEEAVIVFEMMRGESHQPDHLAFMTVINAYISLGKLKDARRLFGEMTSPDVVAWNVMISGHGKRGCETVAIEYFLNMRKSGVKSTRSTLGSVFSAIGRVADLDLGLVVHAEAIKQGLASNIYVGSSLVSMYSKCEKMEAAAKVFEALEERNDVLWNAMIRGYAQNGEAHKVMELFLDMKSSGYNVDDFTFTSLLSTCAASHDLKRGSQFHSIIIKKKLTKNLFVGNALVDMYAKCGALEDARQIFEHMCVRDNISWNTIIGGYVQEENESEAFNLFRRMNACSMVSGEACLASILKACANVHGLYKGKQVHCLSVKCGVETDLHTGSSLIDMYSKCGVTEDAHKVFSSMPEWSVVSMNALIAGYSQNNLEEAVALFKGMLNRGVNPSEITFATIVEACGKPDSLMLGTQFHGQIIKRGASYDDEYLGISLLGLYMNSHRLAEACAIFSELPSPKSNVLWTGMMSGHSQNAFYDGALKFYKEMRHDGVLPDQATFVTILRVCSILSSLREGRAIHSLVFHLAHNLDELTSNTLIDMYAKCGDMKSSSQVFNEMRDRSTVVSWNSMINGYAKNGYAEDALKTFNSMRQTHIMPDEVTFLGVLTACSHAGKVSDGRKIFEMMIGQYGIEARVDHVACMVDLLGRWGYLQEANDFIEAQNLKPDARLWSSLLGACRIHGDDIRGEFAAEKLIKLEPQNSSAYVLLSNVYASQGRWEKAHALRKAMRDRGVKKVPGYSWIDVGQKTHIFAAGDKSHHDIGKIETFLEDLYELMKDDTIVNSDILEHASLDCVLLFC